MVRSTLTEVPSKEKQPSSEYKLFPPFPNPFNPVTTIRYALPKDVKVTLKIYNTLGQLVTTLVDGVQEAGNKSVLWDGSNYASGVYFYRLTAGSYVSTKKLVLMK